MGPWPMPSRGFFAELEERERKALMTRGRHRVLKKGATIFRAGDRGNHLFLLLSGKARIFQVSPTGREVTLWYCLPGEVFGVAEMTRAGRRQVAAEARGECRVLSIDQSAFRAFLAAYPDAAFRFIDLLACRLRLLSELLSDFASATVSQRLCKLLLRLAEHAGEETEEGVALEIVLTHQELADMVGASRQTVSVIIGRLRGLGAVRVERRRLRIPDPKRLEGLAAKPELPPV